MIESKVRFELGLSHVRVSRLRFDAFFFSFFFLFFLLLCTLFGRQWLLFMNSSHPLLTFQFSFISSVGPMNSVRDPQTSLFSNFFIKNRFYSTIHTFKNYFVTVFLVYSF